MTNAVLSFLKNLFRLMFGENAMNFLRKLLGFDARQIRLYTKYDENRLREFNGMFSEETRGKLIASIILRYHVVEKGLTMPDRRMGFGKDAVELLVSLITNFVEKFGSSDVQLRHAIGVVKEYLLVHQEFMKTDFDATFWNKIISFTEKYPAIPAAKQISTNYHEFYKDANADFLHFAHARHTVRHYSKEEIPDELIEKAVALSLTAPSACNRQYCKVYVVSEKTTMLKLLDLQKGNRGFGHLANRVLVVTADLEGIGIAERNDLYTNGGMFLMNLCYSLFYYKIAHCILNWSKMPIDDVEARKLIKIKRSENIIAILSCGMTPTEFDICASPRKSLNEVLVRL